MAAAGLMALGAAGTADAAARAGVFNCTANGGTAFGQSPAVANPAYTPCVPQRKSAPIDVPLIGDPAVLAVQFGAVNAKTLLKTPHALPPYPGDYAQAYGSVADLQIFVFGQKIHLEFVEGSALATCKGTALPYLTTKGGSLDVKINDQLEFDQFNTPLTLPLPIGTLEFNKTAKTANSIEFTAFRFTPTGLPVPVVQAGNAKVGFTGNPCKRG